MLEYLSGMADYVACVQAKYEHAEDASEPPSELSRLASDKEAAVEELEELRALYEARIGPVMGLAR